MGKQHEKERKGKESWSWQMTKKQTIEGERKGGDEGRGNRGKEVREKRQECTDKALKK